MGGKAHGGRRVERAEAQQISAFLAREVGQRTDDGSCDKFALAGSYRRDKADSGDLDFVIVPRDPECFDAFCERKFGRLKNGKISRTGLFDGVQVEFYVATAENWGTFLQMWTGSHRHNIQLRARAKKLGYSMSQYGFRHQETRELVQCATEQEAYDFLGMSYVDPAKR